MEEQREKRNRRLGVLISIGAHVLLLVVFMFILAWREPDPPLPEYGIEINFGLDQQGSGDVQPETEVSPEEEVQDAEEPVESEAEESETEAEEAAEAVEDVPSEPEETTPPEQVTNTQDSPEVIPQEEPKETKPEVKPEKKPEETPKPVEEKKNTEPVKETPKPAETQKPANTSEGDDKDVPGDKGEPEGELNPDAVYQGKPGGGSNGPALNIIGWIWDEVPNKKDASNENGTITFEFTIDEDGYVIGIRTLQRSVSPSVAKFYEQQLQKTTFSRTGTGVAKPGNTKGTVTFNIVSR